MSDDSRRGIFKALHTIQLTDAPIEPAWVLGGSPQARSGCHSVNNDGWAATHVWDCTAGRFKWHFVLEETVLVLEGEVRVTRAEGGETHLLGVGNVGYFPAGSWWVWEVPVHVRKLSFNRRSVPLPARVIGRVYSALMRRLGR